MLQHPGQVSASEVSASAIVPCLSPPGSLVFEDFANLTPFVKEELRFAIQNKHLCHRMSSALESVTVSDRPLEMSVTKVEVGSALGVDPGSTHVLHICHMPGVRCTLACTAVSIWGCRSLSRDQNRNSALFHTPMEMLSWQLNMWVWS